VKKHTYKVTVTANDPNGHSETRVAALTAIYLSPAGFGGDLYLLTSRRTTATAATAARDAEPRQHQPGRG
jgi:hypothetical protein